MVELCNKCNQFEGIHEIPETEQTICDLCQIHIRVKFPTNENFVFYPPNGVKTISVFDDGNQKFQNEQNEWLQIGHCRDHPEKIFLVNKFSNQYINSISSWKTYNRGRFR